MRAVIRYLWNGTKWTLREARGHAVGSLTTLAVLAGIGLIGGYLSLGHGATSSTATPLAQHRRPLPPLTFSVEHWEEGFIIVGIRRHPARCSTRKGVAHSNTRGVRAAALTRRRATCGSSSTVTAAMLCRSPACALWSFRVRGRSWEQAFCEGGGELRAIPIAFNREARTPTASRFARRVVSVAQGEVVPFLVKGIVKSHFVTWKILISAELANGRKLTYVLDDDRRPFRTMPHRDGTPVYEWRWWRASMHPGPYLAVTSNRG